MLVGRFLQERVLAKNRAYLLASDGRRGPLHAARRGQATSRSFAARRSPRATCSSSAIRISSRSTPSCSATRRRVFSLDWINGESAPRALRARRRSSPPAPSARTLAPPRCARWPRSTLAVVSLLRDLDAPRRTTSRARRPWWKRLTSIYVASVLVHRRGRLRRLDARHARPRAHARRRRRRAHRDVPVRVRHRDAARLRARAGAACAASASSCARRLPRSRRRGRARRVRQDGTLTTGLPRRRRTPRCSPRSTDDERAPRLRPRGPELAPEEPRGRHGARGAGRGRRASTPTP